MPRPQAKHKRRLMRNRRWFGGVWFIEEPAIGENPTLVFLTDRNDLDDQLFGQFQRYHEILR